MILMESLLKWVITPLWKRFIGLCQQFTWVLAPGTAPLTHTHALLSLFYFFILLKISKWDSHVTERLETHPHIHLPSHPRPTNAPTTTTTSTFGWFSPSSPLEGITDSGSRSVSRSDAQPTERCWGREWSCGGYPSRTCRGERDPCIVFICVSPGSFWVNPHHLHLHLHHQRTAAGAQRGFVTRRCSAEESSLDIYLFFSTVGRGCGLIWGTLSASPGIFKRYIFS